MMDKATKRRYVTVNVARGLNLRAAASRTAGVIMTLPQGTMLRVTGTPRRSRAITSSGCWRTGNG